MYTRYDEKNERWVIVAHAEDATGFAKFHHETIISPPTEAFRTKKERKKRRKQ